MSGIMVRCHALDNPGAIGETASMLRLARFIPAACLLGLGAGVLYFLHDKGSVEKVERPVRESGEIVFLTVNGPTTYFEDASGQISGLQHDLAVRFAEELGLKLRFDVRPRDSDLIPALEARRGHIAAGSLLATPSRERRVRFGPAYQTITQQVIYHESQTKPRDVKDLAGQRIGVLAQSHHAEKLTELRKQLPGLAWNEFDDNSPDDLFQRLSLGNLDAIVADSDWFSLSHYFYPDVNVAFALGKPEPLAWAFPLAGDDFLYNAATEFFARIQEDGTLKALIAKYYDNARSITRIDVATFTAEMQSRLPRYRAMFEEAQHLTGIDWRLIAAIGYQESHWDPTAESTTGVRGLMMLTENTAQRLKLKNPLDPRESIIAGAQYVALLKEGVPKRIREPDRTWMAIAAYNQGLGHLEDARILAQRLKRNPDNWQDVRAALPLLSDPQHHATLKHGYARGGEAVAMTENVRTYFDILARSGNAHQPAAESVATAASGKVEEEAR